MRIVSFACCLLLFSCSKKATLSDVSSSTDLAFSSYVNEIETARKERLRQLQKPQGWLSVIGLHWLSEGVNTIGAAADNTIVFPRVETETIGAYQLQGDDLFFGKVEGVEVNEGDTEYLGGPVDVSYPPTIANHQSLYWYVIKRGERYGIRLKDTLADQRLNFKGIPYFGIDKKFQTTAKVSIPEKEEMVSITNILGHTNDYPIAAELTFSLDGYEHTIVALDEGVDNYFVILGDATNGDSTYGGGRFLYPAKPAEGDDTILLDFNLLENPPCAFSDFATCPLPPLRNILEIKLLSGELKMNNEH